MRKGFKRKFFIFLSILNANTILGLHFNRSKSVLLSNRGIEGKKLRFPNRNSKRQMLSKQIPDTFLSDNTTYDNTYLIRNPNSSV